MNYTLLIASIVTEIFGALIFLFIFWKRLKEDYFPDIIFRVALCIIVGIVIGSILASRFLPSAFLWISFVGALIGLSAGIFKERTKFYETFEAFVIGVLPWVALSFLSDSVIHSSLSSFLVFISILFLVFISYWLDTHYKRFTWYKSGKIGFAGIATLGLIFLIRSLLAILRVTVLSFISYEAIFSGVAAFICFVLLFNLGRSE